MSGAAVSADGRTPRCSARSREDRANSALRSALGHLPDRSRQLGRRSAAVAVDELADRHLRRSARRAASRAMRHIVRSGRGPDLLEVGQAHVAEALDAGDRPQVGGEPPGGVVDGRLAGDVERRPATGRPVGPGPRPCRSAGRSPRSCRPRIARSASARPVDRSWPEPAVGGVRGRGGRRRPVVGRGGGRAGAAAPVAPAVGVDAAAVAAAVRAGLGRARRRTARPRRRRCPRAARRRWPPARHRPRLGGRTPPSPRRIGAAPPSAWLSSAGMSMPVRPLTVALASVTVRVTFLTTSDAPSFESTVSVVDLAHRLGGRADDLRQHREDGLDDRRLVELAVRLGPQRERLGLGLALATGRCPPRRCPRGSSAWPSPRR